MRSRARRLSFSDGRCSLPYRPYTVKESREKGKTEKSREKGKTEKAKELQGENSVKLSSLPESEIQEKMSEATTSTPLSRVHKQIEALVLEKKKFNKKNNEEEEEEEEES